MFLEISSFYKISISFLLCSVYLTHAVHPWSQSYFMPSPLSTTCCCIKKGPRWQCVSPTGCRGWFPYWRRVTLSSWPLPPTVCSSCLMATRRAKWANTVAFWSLWSLLCPFIWYKTTHPTSCFISADHLSQWRPRWSGVHHEELQLWEATVDYQPCS